MLNRVNTYLKRAPFFGSLFERYSISPPSQGICVFNFNVQDATLLYSASPLGKVEITFAKTFSFSDTNDLVTILSNQVKNLNLENTPCTWMLSPQDYQLILLEDLPVEASEFQSAIRWKIKSLLNFPIEDAVVDSFSVPIQKTFRAQKMIMVVVARASYLLSTVNQMKKSNLKINRIDIPEMGLRNIAVMLEKDDRSTALMYWHDNTINLVITYQNQLYLTRKIDFTYDINNLDASENHKSIEKLALEIQRTFDYFQSQWRVSEPANLLFASSQITDVTDSILKKLSTFVVTPIKNLDLDSIVINAINLNSQEKGRLLPLIGGLLQEEILTHVTTD